MKNLPSATVRHAFRDWCLAGTSDVVGMVSDEVADILISAGLFHQTAGRLSLIEGDLGQSLDTVRAVLASRDLIEPVRGEEMPVLLAPGLKPIARIDRSAMRILGLWAIKVHINGICNGQAGKPDSVWLARRSRNSRAAPGAYDTLVAGGVPYGAHYRSTAVREAWEEAALEPAACQAMTAAGQLRATYVSDQGYHRELLVIYDLVLTKDFRPVCIDGEIESFDRISLAKLGAIARSKSRMKTSSGLVCRDLLRRLTAR